MTKISDKVQSLLLNLGLSRDMTILSVLTSCGRCRFIGPEGDHQDEPLLNTKDWLVENGGQVHGDKKCKDVMPDHVLQWFDRRDEKYCEYLYDRFGVTKSDALVRQAHSFFSHCSGLVAYHENKTSGLLKMTEDGLKNVNQTKEGRERLAAQGKEAYHVDKTSGLLEKTEGGWKNISQTEKGRERFSKRVVAMQRAGAASKLSKSTVIVYGKVPTGTMTLKCNTCGWESDPIHVSVKKLGCAGRCGEKHHSGRHMKDVYRKSGSDLSGNKGFDYRKPSSHWKRTVLTDKDV